MGLYNRIRKILHKVDNNDEVAVARYIGVKVGDNCSINDNARKVFSMEPYLVTLGDNVAIAPDVRFVTHDGGITILRRDEEFRDMDCFAPIVVGNNVFIGMGSVILLGVNIGDNVIIGANSVVTKDVPDNSVVAGSPARFICSVAEYKERLANSNKKYIVPTKHMSAEKKKEYLVDRFPEWFDTGVGRNKQ